MRVRLNRLLWRLPFEERPLWDGSAIFGSSLGQTRICLLWITTVDAKDRKTLPLNVLIQERHREICC
jgi:hypothetical protein